MVLGRGVYIWQLLFLISVCYSVINCLIILPAISNSWVSSFTSAFFAFIDDTGLNSFTCVTLSLLNFFPPSGKIPKNRILRSKFLIT